MWKAIREFLEAVLLAALVFFVLQTTVQNFKVEGSSMKPTLADAQYLLVNKAVYTRFDLARISRFVPFWDVKAPRTVFPFHPPNRGDVIVFRFPKDPRRDFVKRVIGLPGEKVEMVQGDVYINGELLREPYLADKGGYSMAARVVGPGQYFVLGDNRGGSNDSRDWGTVPLEDVIGKVWFTYWPTSRLRLIHSMALPLGYATSLAHQEGRLP